MNHIHRLVWNERIGAFVAVGETTSRRGKRSGVSGALVAAALLGAGLSQAHAQAAPPHQALPKGGQVVAGQARLSTSGNTLDVQQTSQKAIINWQSFNIGADAKVNFSQPNAASVALNRVVGTDPSAIFGSLTSNGQVFLLNPNGVLFGAGARVDVGGLAATTMALSDADFLAGRYRFTEGRASVVNEGDLSAHDGGYIALMAPEVINGGVVNATLGTVALAAGNAVTLKTEGALAFTIDQGALDALVENHQAIRADGGHVLIGAQSSAALQRAVIRNDGLIEARGARSVGGVIRLEAGTIASSGTVDASGLGTDGGSVELRAGTGAGGSVTVAGGVAATGARGGNIVITGNTVELLGAQVNTSGDHGGGQVLLGGGAQGQDALVENASHTLVDAGSQVHADALRDGAGGQVVAWADQRSVVAGTLTARGGAGGGDGGAIETSGKVSLDLAGAHVDASAPAGRDGRWLLDPSDITITHGATGALAGGLFDPGTSSSIGDAQINAALNGGTNVTIQTSSGTGGSGSIVVNGNSDSGGAVVIANASGGTRSLSLTADGSIDIHSGASLAGTTGNALDVHLSAVGGNTVSGTIDNAGGTTTFGGALTLNGTIRNGTLAGTDATPLLQSNNGRLDGMTVGGTSLSASGSVFVLNDLALASGVDLAITNSNWYFDGQNTGQAAGTVHHLSTLGTATIDLIGSNLNLYAVNGQTLDIGAGITIQGSGSLNETWNGNTLQNTVTNAGTIIATGVNQALSFNVDAFVNTGTVAASGGGALYVNNAFTNSGVVHADGGAVNLNGTWTNPGKVIVDSGALNLGGTFTTADLTGAAHFERNGGDVNITGTLDNTGTTLDIGSAGLFGAGGLTSLNNGRILNGTVLDTDATPVLQSNNGRLDGVTLAGTNFGANGSLFVWNDLTLASGVDLAITNSNWYFDGQNTGQAAGTVHHLSTLGTATIDLIGSNLNLYAVNGQTLDIGAGITIQGSGSLNETWNGNTLQNTVTNAGTIIATGVNQALSFNVDAFVNTGTVAASGGGALYVNNAFTNSGVVHADGGAVNLNGTWTNPGKVIVDSGALNLGGTFTTADLTGAAHFERNGGDVNITGTLDNTGATLDIGSAGLFGAGGLTSLNNGRILNGTVLDTDATPVLQSNNGRLDGVTLAGTNFGASGSLYVWNDLTLASGVDLAITNSNWYFDGQDVNQGAGVVHHLLTPGAATLDLVGSNLYIFSTFGQTLDIGAGVTIRGYGSLTQYWGGNTIVNNGAIIANVSGQGLGINPDVFNNTGSVAATDGGTLEIAGQFTNSGVAHVDGGSLNIDASWTNPGKVIVDSGALNLGGTVATAELTGATHFERNGGDVNITGTLDNTGTTLDIGSAGIFGTGGLTSLNNGRILNGTVLDTDATPLLQSNNGKLDGVTLAGTNFGASGSLYVWNDLTLASGVDLAITNSNWYFDGQDVNQGAGVVHHLLTSGAATVDLNGSNLYIFSTFGQTLDIGSGVTIRGYGSLTQYWGGNTIVNNGAIIANVSGQGLGINPDVFNNTGSVTATNGATLEIAGQLTNSGVAHVDGGSLNIDATWTNPGKVVVDSGALNLGGTVATAELTGATHFERNGGDVNITGTLDNTGATLDIGSAGLFGPGGLTSLNNGRILNGTVLDTDATPVLQSNNGKLDGVTLAGTNFGASGSLYVWNDLTLASGVDVAITNSNWYFDGQNVNQGAGVVHQLLTSGTATLDLNGSNLYIFSTFGQTLDIGAGITVRGYGSLTQYWGGNTIVNNGTLSSNTAGQSLRMDTDYFVDNGNIHVAGGAYVDRPQGFTSSGILSGSGTIRVGTGANRLVNAGVIDPGGTGATGTLHVDGDLQLAAGSTTNVELAGTQAGQFDALAVTGTVTGDTGSSGSSFGALNVSRINGFFFVDAAGDHYDLLRAASGADSGSFGSATVARATVSASYAPARATLTVVPDMLTVTADPLSKVYGQADPGFTWSATGFDGGDNAANALTGAIGRTAGKDVGYYDYQPGTLVSPLGYAIQFTSGPQFQITPASITLTAQSSTKVYDGGYAALASATVAAGALFYGDNLSGGTFTFANKNVGAGKTVSTSGVSVGDGVHDANYNVSYVDSTSSSITPYVVNLTGARVYDATIGVAANWLAMGTLPAGETLSLSGSASLGTKDVGAGKSATAGSLALVSGTGLATNYTLVGSAIEVDVTPRSIVVGGVGASNKTYDATTAATLTGTASVTALGSDDLGLAGAPSAQFVDKNAGASKAVVVSGYALSGADAGNYAIVQPTGLAATITPASLSVTGVAAASKVYDATTAATLNGTASVVALGSDDVTVNGGAGSFVDKNVGTSKAVTATGFALAGADAGNYVLVQPTGLAANITPATLAVSGVTAVNKVYDATTAATLNGTASVAALGSDDVTVSGGAGSFVDKNVGNGKAVAATGFALAGADAANYVVVQPTGLAANITPATLAVSGVTAVNKVYDATTAATLNGTASVAALGSDDVTVSGGAGSFVDKNVGTSKAVTATGFALAGADAGNYVVVQPTGLAANITPATLAVGGVTAVNKVYDATTAATLNGTASVVALGSDDVTVNGGAGSFVDKNVGNSKAVTASGFALAGADAGNYVLVQPTGLAANITPATLAVSGVTAVSKVYDATTAATLNGTASVAALGSDDVTVSGGAGSFVDKNVGNGKAVAATGFALAGADAGNYVLVQPTGLAANITPATLAVSGVTAVSKVYDATTAATLNGTASVAALGSDDVTVSGDAGSFVDKNVGTSKAVTATGFALAGADAGNYVLVQPTGLAANVTPATLAVSGVTAVSKVYDATTAATLNGTASVAALGSDDVTVNGGAGSFVDKNVGTGKAVTASGFALAGADAGNYVLVQPIGLAANITPAALVVSGITAANKTYDGTTSATLSGGATVSALAGDSVTVGGSGQGLFASAGVANGVAVSVSGYALQGADAGNYQVVQPTGLAANIMAAAPQVVVTAPVLGLQPPPPPPASASHVGTAPIQVAATAVQVDPAVTPMSASTAGSTPTADSPMASATPTSVSAAVAGPVTLAVPVGLGADFVIALPPGVTGASNGAVVREAIAEDGGPLPSWLTYTPQSRTFSGKVPPGLKTLTVRVVLADGQVLPVRLTFSGTQVDASKP